MIKLKQSQIVEIFIQKLKNFGPSSTGTYNNADPTHFEKGTAIFGMQQSAHTGLENISVEWYDCTWGIQFVIRIPSTHEKINGYWSREFGNAKSKWINCHEKFLDIVAEILVSGKEEDWWEADRYLMTCYK